jgi:Ca2+-binding EF-hand superfamily protein
MNINDDPLIDHDEWLEYMLKLFVGNFERRLFIVFQMFDLNNDEVVKAENMKLILRHLPIWIDHNRYGISHEAQNES